MKIKIYVTYYMSLQVGIMGLPNVGKSTIFNALTESSIPAENYPFCTIDPNIGIVEVPDIRLKHISEIYNPNKLIPATVEFVDIAGLVRGASKGEGLGNTFLSHIRNVDAIIHVLRCFQDSNVSHVEGSIDPIRDIEIIETELLIKDIESCEKRLAKSSKKAKSGDKKAILETKFLEKLLIHLNKGNLLKTINFDKNEIPIIKEYNLLTFKPILYVTNVDENEISQSTNTKLLKQLTDFIKEKDDKAITLCGSIEMDIAMMNPNDRKLFLSEYNLIEPGLHKLIRNAYELLGLETYFTAGEKEVKAWTIKKGSTAPEAAGVIHSDFQRGFIKAEIFHFDELINFGSELKIKEAGKIRQEGKSYIVKDGDIIYFKFNV